MPQRFAAPARTIALIRQLRTIGHTRRKRPGRLPRQQQPDAIRLAYFNAIRHQACDLAREAFAHEHREILWLLAEHRRRHNITDARTDADPGDGEAERKAQALIKRAAGRFANAYKPEALEAVAQKFGQRTTDFQREQFDKQVRAAMGVPYAALERPVREMVPVFAKANTELIKTVPDRYWDRIAKETREAFEGGEHPDTLAQRWADADDMALDDARRIARDQIGKLNAQVNQQRQEALGVARATWRGVLDNRECDECRDREGKSFDWDEGLDGQFPGECHPMDRCWAEPDFSDILGDLDG